MNLHDFMKFTKLTPENENISAGYCLLMKSMLSDWKNDGDLP